MQTEDRRKKIFTPNLATCTYMNDQERSGKGHGSIAYYIFVPSMTLKGLSRVVLPYKRAPLVSIGLYIDVGLRIVLNMTLNWFITKWCLLQ